MKPKHKNHLDDIDRLLLSTWEESPEDFHDELLEIPDWSGAVNHRASATISLFLDLIMLLWGIMTIYLFRGLWMPLLGKTVELLHLPRFDWESGFSNPFSIMIYLLGLAFITWWMMTDMVSPRRGATSPKNKGPR
jgi:hypothetical protein